jgi:hypothetical protein
MYARYLFRVAVVVFLSFLAGCGGSSGSSNTTTTVSGTVEASKLKGVNICVKNTTNCVKTDSNGAFTIKNVTLPSTLEIKIGDSVFTDISVSSNSVTITPSKMADSNATLASYIGAFLHKVADCSMNEDSCDLSNINSLDIDSSSNKDLLDELKEKAQSSSTITFKKNRQSYNLISADVSLYTLANPTMIGKSTIDFTGSASAGDFATFSFDKNSKKLNFKINGSVFGSKSGNIDLEDIYGHVFFKDKNGDNFYFFSGSLGVAVIPNANNNTDAYIVGLQMPDKNLTSDDIALIANKKFNYIEFSSDDDVSFEVIEINATDGATSGSWRSLVEQDSHGTWEVEGNHLAVKDPNGEKVANVIIRAGESRAGIVVDLVGGAGFGVGVEAKPLEANELSGRFYYQDSSSNSDVMCYGYVDVNGESFSYHDRWCSDNDTNSGNGSLELNPTVNGVTLNGVARVSGTNEYVFMDPDDGYYIAIDMDEGDLSIGSNKPLY